MVENLNTITLQDSLQRLAKMTDKERERAIEKMIKRLKREEEARKEEQKRKELLLQSLAAKNQIPTSATTQAGGAGAWYFYNPATVSSGVADFNKKWGDRKLEDNWRRSQKQQEAEEEENNVDTTTSPVAKAVTDSTGNNSNIKDKDYYLKTIPSSPEELAQSNIKIIDAFYNVGVIYKEQLNNNQKSVQEFEELLKRYPDNKYKLTVYYQLYRTYLAMNNTPKSDYYKNILLNDYPDTEYAKIIRNPDYAKNLEASKNDIEKFYDQTYQLYLRGNYTATIENCNKAESSYSKNYLMPQFDFLKAMSIGHTQDKKALEAALTQVVIKHPIGPIKDRAQQILDLMKTQGFAVDSLKKKQAVDSIESLNYYWITVTTIGKGNINKFKEKITMITETAFPKDSLIVSIDALSNTSQIMCVKTLKGKTKGMDYYNFMKSKEQVFSDLEMGSYQTLIISSDNYILLQKDKNINIYLQVFNDKLK